MKYAPGTSVSPAAAGLRTRLPQTPGNCFPLRSFSFFHIFHLIFLKNLLSTEIRSSPSSGSDIDYYDENADASYSFDFEADGYNRLVIIV